MISCLTLFAIWSLNDENGLCLQYHYTGNATMNEATLASFIPLDFVCCCQQAGMAARVSDNNLKRAVHPALR